MIKDKNFWVGAILGAVLAYFYCQRMKKGPGA